MKVHSRGVGFGEDCEFVYVDEDGNFLVAACVDFMSCPVTFNQIPLFFVSRSEDEVEYTDVDPDSRFECLGEL